MQIFCNEIRICHWSISWGSFIHYIVQVMFLHLAFELHLRRNMARSRGTVIAAALWEGWKVTP
jgi:hypothetical protein